MAGSKIINGTPVDAPTTNTALLGRQADDTATGIISWANTDVLSGPTILNGQLEWNGLDFWTGRTANDPYNTTPAWTTNESFLSSDNLFIRTDDLSNKFPVLTGHVHAGSPGDGGFISAPSIISVSLSGIIRRGVDILAVTGGFSDVSSQFSSAVPSLSGAAQGIVVNAPENQGVIRQATGANEGDEFVDAFGNTVYSRITNSGGVGGTWTLTYYVLIGGTETPYSFATPVDVAFYYQQLVNPINNGFPYNPFWAIPSDNATQDVVDATPTQSGKVNTTTQSFGGLKTFNQGIGYFEYADGTVTGSSAAIPLGTYRWVQLTNASLVSVATISTPTAGEIRIITNLTGNPINILNESGSPSTNRITTGTGNDIKLENTGTIFVAYDAISFRWRAIGSDEGISSLFGDVVATGPGAASATIQPNVVSNSKLAQMPMYTFKGNNTGSTADPQDVSASAAFQTLSPLTTKGDLLSYSTMNNRFPVGTDGYILSANSVQPFGLQWIPNSGGSGSSVQNLLINGAFDFWQWKFAASTTCSATGTYMADRWYGVDATTGTTGVNMNSNPGVLDGSIYTLSIQFGGGATGGTLELWQVLDNLTTMQIFNKSASFAIQILGIANVNQVGIQFFYDTTEVKPTNAYGSEQLFTVNNATYTLCSVNNVAIGTGPTQSGVVGVRIRVTGVSSGNIWDSGNGFFVEQGMMNMGTSAATFQRAGMPEEELVMCERFFQKSYDTYTNPTAITFNGAQVVAAQPGDNPAFTEDLIRMRAVPTVVYYNPGTGATGSVRGIGSSANVTINALASGEKAIAANTNAITLSDAYAVHYTADAEI